MEYSVPMTQMLLEKIFLYYKTFAFVGVHISLKLLSGDVEQVRSFENHICVSFYQQIINTDLF